MFADKVLGALGLNLELKSKGYEVQALSCIFLLNNYHYIHKSLTRQEDVRNFPGCVDEFSFLRNDAFLSTLEQESPDIEDHYLELIAEQRRGYQKWLFVQFVFPIWCSDSAEPCSWSKVLNHILEVTKPQMGVQSEKIRSAEKVNTTT